MAPTRTHKKVKQIKRKARDVGQNTIYIVVAVLLIIALCLYIFGRARGA